MILKGSQRANGADLAIHLMNSFDNERVEIAEVYGTVAGRSHGRVRRIRGGCAGHQGRKISLLPVDQSAR